MLRVAPNESPEPAGAVLPVGESRDRFGTPWLLRHAFSSAIGSALR